MKSDRLLAVGGGLLVCAIWASSFVIVKMALAHIGPLALAGVRYFTAFLLLLPLMVRRGELASNPAPGHWWHLAAIGVCAYAIGNGTLYWGLQYLPATTGSFLLTLIPVGVLLLGILRLKEVPTGWQVVGLVVALGGGALFFSPGLGAGELRAVVVVGAGLLAFAVFGVLGREVARTGQVATLSLTAIPLGIGGGLALVVALVVEGLPSVSLAGWAIVLWLAAVNTAAAYLLYNHSLRTLTALEMNVILNLSPLGTAFLAAYLLDERVTAAQWVGIVVLILGVCVVQWGGWRASKMKKVESYG
ncbi:MAG: EamA family transporter [Ardenticatenales bacterium]|nr:EamA family transporter [Ardenticatenales bacterium]